MTFEPLSLGITIAVLAAASIPALRSREVPDWLNYSFLTAAFGLRALTTIISADWTTLLEGCLGFAMMFVIAYVIFYTGQMGGGDAKLLMGMGMLLGLPLRWSALIG